VKLFKPKAAQVALPVEAEFLTQIDNINGTRAERVKQPDGTYAIVTSRLALSPEEQAYEDQLKAIASDSLNWINKLTNNYNRDDIPWLNDYLTDYENTTIKAIDKAFGDRINTEEKALARFGQADSTSASEVRSGRGNDLTDQRRMLQAELSSVEGNARTNAINQYGSLYGLATGSSNNIQSQLSAAGSNNLSAGYTGQNIQQGYNNALAGGQTQQNALNAQASQQGLSNLANVAKLAAAPFTGGASLMIPTGGNSNGNASLFGLGFGQLGGQTQQGIKWN